MRAAVAHERGTVFKHTGDGVLAVFDEALEVFHRARRLLRQRGVRGGGAHITEQRKHCLRAFQQLTGTTAPEVFHELGAEVICIGCNPDGVNINDRCGSTHPESLQDAVQVRRVLVHEQAQRSEQAMERQRHETDQVATAINEMSSAAQEVARSAQGAAVAPATVSYSSAHGRK